jgi:hypothetical protein
LAGILELTPSAVPDFSRQSSILEGSIEMQTVDVEGPEVVEQETCRLPAESNTTRFHDMDSLRAAMMLLGIVFHAAWFFCPVYFGHTLSDTGAAPGYLYFFVWVHQFRMQVFFLIAGFFACLLIEKRGVWNFVINRGKRVVIPFVIVMLTLYPLMKLQYIRGGNTSARILSDQSIWQQFVEVWPSIDWWNEWPIHLWFLECLILLYAISLAFKLLFQWFDRSGNLRARIIRAINNITGSHLGPLWLAFPIAAPLAYELTWFGIDTGPLYPQWAGVLAYWFIFAVGWCLYRKSELIDRFVARWPTYLIIGSLISLLLGGYFHKIMMNGQISWFYPVILDTEMNYDSLRPKLLAADAQLETANAQPDAKYRVLWGLLSPKFQDFVRKNETPDSDALSSLAEELTTVTVFNADFPSLMRDFGEPTDQEKAVPHEQSAAESLEVDAVANRELLAKIYPSEFFGFWTPPLYVRLSYFYAYGVATWLMTFAMLGLFRQYLHRPSATLRYLADSSYWLYLVHLPLQFELSLYVADWPGGFWKFLLLYNILVVAILLVSYHYLVRSTWIGQFLNGRRYPT